jgi:adenylosuccinate synthase
VTVCAVVGGQFGSEGKGAVTAYLARTYDHHVRAGAANAGHTMFSTWGGLAPTRHVMQQVPCAAYANPLAALYLGPGALISPEILSAEMEKLHLWRAKRKLQFSGETLIYIDHHAQVISPAQIAEEQKSGLAERIGSTSTIAKEGIGVAQADRVMRAERCVEAEEVDWNRLDDWGGIETADVPFILDTVLRANEKVLLEGTQGTGLSLTTGFFPYVTSRNTTAAGLCADCGVAPGRVDRVVLVLRTYPIRVAGPSGPFYHDSEEIDWQAIGVNPEAERTTVTRKIRRVATFSMEQAVEAVRLNGATEIALMFADYIEPFLHGSVRRADLDESPAMTAFIQMLEDATGIPVTMVGTGPRSIIRRGFA